MSSNDNFIHLTRLIFGNRMPSGLRTPQDVKRWLESEVSKGNVFLIQTLANKRLMDNLRSRAGNERMLNEFNSVFSDSLLTRSRRAEVAARTKSMFPARSGYLPKDASSSIPWWKEFETDMIARIRKGDMTAFGYGVNLDSFPDIKKKFYEQGFANEYQRVKHSLSRAVDDLTERGAGNREIQTPLSLKDLKKVPIYSGLDPSKAKDKITFDESIRGNAYSLAVRKNESSSQALQEFAKKNPTAIRAISRIGQDRGDLFWFTSRDAKQRGEVFLRRWNRKYNKSPLDYVLPEWFGKAAKFRKQGIRTLRDIFDKKEYYMAFLDAYHNDIEARGPKMRQLKLAVAAAEAIPFVREALNDYYRMGETSSPDLFPYREQRIFNKKKFRWEYRNDPKSRLSWRSFERDGFGVSDNWHREHFWGNRRKVRRGYWHTETVSGFGGTQEVRVYTEGDYWQEATEQNWARRKLEYRFGGDRDPQYFEEAFGDFGGKQYWKGVARKAGKKGYSYLMEPGSLLTSEKMLSDVEWSIAQKVKDRIGLATSSNIHKRMAKFEDVAHQFFARSKREFMEAGPRKSRARNILGTGREGEAIGWMSEPEMEAAMRMGDPDWDQGGVPGSVSGKPKFSARHWGYAQGYEGGIDVSEHWLSMRGFRQLRSRFEMEAWHQDVGQQIGWDVLRASAATRGIDIDQVFMKKWNKLPALK